VFILPVQAMLVRREWVIRQRQVLLQALVRRARISLL
jgi:hypothetical protein